MANLIVYLEWHLLYALIIAIEGVLEFWSSLEVTMKYIERRPFFAKL
jgi:hypothetical protein